MEKSGQSSHRERSTLLHLVAAVPPMPEKERGRRAAKKEERRARRPDRRRIRIGQRSTATSEKHPRRAGIVTSPSLGPCMGACVCVCKLSREALKVILGPHQTRTREHWNLRPVSRGSPT